MRGSSSTADPIQPFWVIDSVRYLKRTSRIPAVAHFYKFKASSGVSSSFVVPDGAVDIIMECGSDNLNARICGPVSRGRTSSFEEGKTYFGIRLRPEALSHVGTASIAELADHEYVLADLIPGSDLLDHIGREGDFARQAKMFEMILERDNPQVIPNDTAHHVTALVIDAIYRHNGIVRVVDLESELGYSRRHLTRCFSTVMGLGIKTFAQHVRFQYVLHGIRDGAFASAAEASAACGYYDQSHFTKDFRAFTDMTPSDMARLFRDSDYAHRITLC